MTKTSTNHPIIKNIFGVSEGFLGELRSWLESNPPTIPIEQIQGFQRFTAKADQVSGEESTASNTFTDLTTAGPSLTKIPDGSYVVFFGASLQAIGGNEMIMGISINGNSPNDSHVVESATTTNLSLSHGLLVTLSGGDNSIVAKYRMSAGTSAGSARYRWLIAFRYA